MKKLILALCIVPLMSRAQTSVKDSLKFLKDTIELASLPIDSTGAITYKLIEKTPGISQIELYNRAKIWSALAFNSSKNVTQLEDKESGSIIIKALSKQTYIYKSFGSKIPVNYYLHFSLQFTLRDGKYRVILSNFSVETEASLNIASTTYTLEKNYQELKEWNGNAKTGNMQFNRMNDRGPKTMRPQFDIINNLDFFAKNTISDAKSALSKPAKSDEF